MDDLLVGFGGVGFMNITGGGLVDQNVGADPDAQVAVSDLSANIGAGTVVVNGDDSRWNFRQGEFGSAGLGSVAVEAGGRIAATADVTVGLSSTSQGSLYVTGTGALADSLVSVDGDLIVGKLGQGTLTVDLGGDVTVGDNLFVGGDPNNLNDNVVTITNPGSSVMVANFFDVGKAGFGTLNITDGATVSSHKLTAGALPNSTGDITLNGTDSSSTALGTLIGEQGTGSLTISGGAHLESGRFWAGQYDGSEGTVDIVGSGSTLTVTFVNQIPVSLRIGGHDNFSFSGGTGTVTVSEGGTIIAARETRIGTNATAVGSLTVTGPTSLADFNDGGTDDATVVGYAGEGTLSILDGGRVESEVAMLGQLAGSPGASGTVEVGDGNALANWNVAGSLYVGGSDTLAGGTGLLNINSQGTVTVGDELKIWDDGTVVLDNETATLSAGTLTRTAGSQFDFLRGNLVLTGSGLDVNPAGQLGGSVSIVPGQTLSTTGGGLVNDGDLSVIGTTVSFTGGPSVNNPGAEVNAINATLTFDGDLTNNGDVNLINSTVNGNLINGGTGSLAMIGSNSFSDDLHSGAQDNLNVDISGPESGEFDSLTVGGEAALDGSLNVSLVSGFTPSAGDTFDILTAAGGVDGTFATENLPTLLGDLQWFVNYDATSLTLVSTWAADFNEDGNVNGDDLADWEAGYGSLDAAHIQGDADGDGDSDGTDFLIWQRQVGTVVTPVSANRTVPEPCCLILALAVGIFLGSRRCPVAAFQESRKVKSLATFLSLAICCASPTFAQTLDWTRQLGTSSSDRSNGVSADGLGNVYISGLTSGDLGGTNAGLSDAFVSKYDDSGTLQWTEQLGTSSNDRSYGVSADGLGNVYISGLTKGDLGGTHAGALGMRSSASTMLPARCSGPSSWAQAVPTEAMVCRPMDWAMSTSQASPRVTWGGPTPAPTMRLSASTTTAVCSSGPDSLAPASPTSARMYRRMD